MNTVSSVIAGVVGMLLSLGVMAETCSYQENPDYEACISAGINDEHYNPMTHGHCQPMIRVCTPDPEPDTPAPVIPIHITPPAEPSELAPPRQASAPPPDDNDDLLDEFIAALGLAWGGYYLYNHNEAHKVSYAVRVSNDLDRVTSVRLGMKVGGNACDLSLTHSRVSLGWTLEW